MGCAVAYRRKYLKALFDHISPILGDDLTNSEDIFIGFAMLNEGYRNVQLTDVYARTVEPEIQRLPRQIYLWSSSFLQSCYYFDSLVCSPFKVFKRWRIRRRRAMASQPSPVAASSTYTVTASPMLAMADAGIERPDGSSTAQVAQVGAGLEQKMGRVSLGGQLGQATVQGQKRTTYGVGAHVRAFDQSQKTINPTASLRYLPSLSCLPEGHNRRGTPPQRGRRFPRGGRCPTPHRRPLRDSVLTEWPRNAPAISTPGLSRKKNTLAECRPSRRSM